MSSLPKDMSLTVKELARLLDCPVVGDGETIIRGVASLEKAGEGDLVFFSQNKFRKQLEETKASAAIVPLEEGYDRIPVLKSPNPHLTFIKAIEVFYRPFRIQAGVHPSADVSASAKIESGVAIGAMSYIGEEAEIGSGTVIFPLAAVFPRVRIGKNCVVYSHVSIREDTRIGDRVIIHNGAVIGSDGFGSIKTEDGTYRKIPQIGRVVIEADVEIGANTAIDRAALGETTIKKGTKVDNLVQIAHNVEVGPNAILAGQTGIAGSVKIGKNVITGGQVGISDHVEIGDGVIAAAKSGITKSIPAGSFVAGSPHVDIRDWRKIWVLLPQLYDYVKEIKDLKKRIEELERHK